MTNLKTIAHAPASSLCFGTMQFGGSADIYQSQAMFEACIEAGVNFFDTAYVYTDGASETMLGQFLKSDRDTALVATKCAYTGGSGEKNITAQFDESRRRLNLDTVDILYLHRWDNDTDLNETFATLCNLKDQGALRYIGLSNCAAWQAMKAAHVAEKFDLSIDILQPMYSLVKRQAEVEILPMAKSEGIAVAPYSPLGAGVLTGKYASGGTGRLSQDSRYKSRYGKDWMFETGEKLKSLADEAHTPAATLAVSWAMKHPAVTAPIISARNADQLQPSLDALRFNMDDTLYSEISALSVAPAPATDRLEEA
ncbi:aldo/keto reductase [Cochlodiniinecator piscidefendens]|uniref:aldo/keto reductase n=1 Tax=Cochlodiniinecator piscidefendens TaxID=2715756 RepID=UPI0014088AFF|nr:aldo/keto reductase [Cochlodiniinecator piscidefendens]